MFGYAARRLGWHDAGDATAEVFAVAWRRMRSVPDEPDALPWLYGVARRVREMGGSLTVDLETTWTLLDRSTQQVLLRKAVQTQHTVTMGESLAGVTRLRLAVEGGTKRVFIQLKEEMGTSPRFFYYFDV